MKADIDTLIKQIASVEVNRNMDLRAALDDVSPNADHDEILREIAELVGTAQERGHRFGSPPEPVSNPTPDWCERYADWYYQGKG